MMPPQRVLTGGTVHIYHFATRRTVAYLDEHLYVFPTYMDPEVVKGWAGLLRSAGLNVEVHHIEHGAAMPPTFSTSIPRGTLVEAGHLPS